MAIDFHIASDGSPRGEGCREDFLRLRDVAVEAAADVTTDALRVRNCLRATLAITGCCVTATMPMGYWLSAQQFRVPRIRNPARVQLFTRGIVGLVGGSILTFTAAVSPIGWWTWYHDLCKARDLFDECYFTAEVAADNLHQQRQQGGRKDAGRGEVGGGGGGDGAGQGMAVSVTDAARWEQCMLKLHHGRQLATAPLWR